MSNVKTVTLAADAVTTVRFDASFPYYWIDNQTEDTIYAAIGAEPVPETDGTFTVPAGGKVRLSGGITPSEIKLKGSGKVQIVASGIAECPFNSAPVSGGGKELTGNSSYTTENTVDYPLIGLNLYGKSTQNGTPTPGNPVDIVSVGDSGFDIISKNDKHFNLLSVRDNGGEIITKQPVSAVGGNGETKQFIVSASGSGLTYQWWQNVNNGNGWVIMDTAGARQPIFNIPVAAFRNGYKYRCVVADSNGNSETSNEVTLYVVSDECEINTASIETALPLCGIPVSSGGNYTDSNGQRWICDELIYNADGSGKISKHTAKIDSYNGETISGVYISTTGSLTTGATVIYQINSPQEIQLTAAEMTAFRQLKTFNGVTSISNNSGAEMSVKYCSNKALSEFAYPVTMGLQKQIDELRAAILSMGGNV